MCCHGRNYVDLLEYCFSFREFGVHLLGSECGQQILLILPELYSFASLTDLIYCTLSLSIGTAYYLDYSLRTTVTQKCHCVLCCISLGKNHRLEMKKCHNSELVTVCEITYQYFSLRHAK